MESSKDAMLQSSFEINAFFMDNGLYVVHYTRTSPPQVFFCIVQPLIRF